MKILLNEINAYRASRRLSILEPDTKLVSIAQSWSELIAWRGQMVHGNFQARVHSFHRAAGEIIAPGPDPMNLWINSPDHLEILLRRDWTIIGIGVANTRRGLTFYVVDFVA